MNSLSPREIVLLGSMEQVAAEAGRVDLAASMEESRTALESIASAFDHYPSPMITQELGANKRTLDSLIATLSTQNPFSIDMAVPTRSLVGRAFIMARLNFFRMLRHVCRELGMTDGAGTLRGEVETNITECIYQKAGEELLLAIVSRPDAEQQVRERAAALLLRIWHHGPRTELRDVVPLLAQTWEARRRTRVALGTMLGASEIFGLLTAGCDARFVEFLTRTDVTEEEVAAFREFLFGLTWEEIARISKQSDEGGRLADQETVKLAGGGGPLGHFRAGDRVEGFYLFFAKRHLNAISRRLQNREGPKMTAEQYVLENSLSEHGATMPP